jgi:hypothetical protein
MLKKEMASYLFRVKADWDPRNLWRDIVIGGARSLEDLHRTINTSFEIGFDHLWFFGIDRDFWRSRRMYKSPMDFENLPKWMEYLDHLSGINEVEVNAAGVSIDELNLKVGDRLCYLFDYADEWRFYLILKKILEDEPSQKEPMIVKGKGEIF